MLQFVQRSWPKLLLLSFVAATIVTYALSVQTKSTHARLFGDAAVTKIDLASQAAVLNATIAAAAVAPAAVAGVIFYLARSLTNDDNHHLFNSLIALHQNFNCKYKYPIVIFTSDSNANKRQFQNWVQTSLWPTNCALDSNYSYQFHDSTTSNSSRNSTQQPPQYSITYTDVTFSFPASLNVSTIPERTICSEQGIGYRSMCRWQALAAVDELELQGYDYFWRFDNDGLLTEPLTFDPFRYMQQHELVYGFNMITGDKHDCITDLWKTTHNYVSVHHPPKSPTALPEGNFLDKFHEQICFYNNFEISRFDFWRSPRVRAYLDHIDNNHSIFTQRWGDAPIKSLAVAMFAAARDVHYFGDVHHLHQGLRTGEGLTNQFLEQIPFHRPEKAAATATKAPAEDSTQAAAAAASTTNLTATAASLNAATAQPLLTDFSSMAVSVKLFAEETTATAINATVTVISIQQLLLAAVVAWIAIAACYWLYGNTETVGPTIYSALQAAAMFMLFTSEQQKQQARVRS